MLGARLPEDIAREAGSIIIGKVGGGAFGEAYLLANDRILKITRMQEELRCASWILDHRIWRETAILPVVFAAGSTWMEFAESLVPHYWYVRERVDDITPEDVAGIEKLTDRPIEEVLGSLVQDLEQMGLEIRDSKRLRNWGKRLRRGGFDLVLRDLWCVVRN